MNDKQVFNSKLTDFFTFDREGVGRVRWERQNSNSPLGLGSGMCGYRFVYNNTGSALTVGQPLSHGTAGFALTTGINPSVFDEEVVTFGQSGKGTFVNLFAGIAISAIPADSYGWIQIQGPNNTVTVEGTTAIAAGDYLKGSSGNAYLIKDTSGGTAPTAGRRGAIALAAKGTAGTANIAAYIQAF